MVSSATLVCNGARSILRVEQALRTELSLQRKLRRMFVTAAIIGPVALAPEVSFAEGLFDFFFRAFQGQQQ